jgi:CheY-like chemotaxis protein
MIVLKYAVGLDSSLYCDFALSGHSALQMVMDDIEEQRQEGGIRISSKYNLIFMDCNMPEMDGNETTQRIREFLYSQHSI